MANTQAVLADAIAQVDALTAEAVASLKQTRGYVVERTTEGFRVFRADGNALTVVYNNITFNDLLNLKAKCARHA